MPDETRRIADVVEDDVRTALSDLDAGDRALVQVRAPKGGTASFTARMVVAESPLAYFADEEVPERLVGVGGDNCAEAANPDQADGDGDGVACDEPEPTPEPSL